jgi:small-conductance mechanosensitive channel
MMIQADSTSLIDPITENLDPLVGRASAPLFSIGGTPVTIASLLTFVGFIVLSFVLSALLQRVMGRVYRRRDVDVGVQYSLNRLLHYVILATGFILAIDNLGISLTALAAVGGVLLVGIGFGLQNIAQNFVSGLILLLERPVRKGDFIEVAGAEGTVTEIRARATLINTYDDIEIIIPNGKLITEIVTNRAFQQRYYRIRINVGVAYGSDTEMVRDTLIRVATEHPDILPEPEPIVFFENFGDSALDFRLMGWIADPRLQPRVRSDLRFSVDRAFREAGIEVPFPQRDLHLRSGWPPSA